MVNMSPLPDGYRVHWWAVLMQLHKKGLHMNRISTQTAIPKSTLLGFKNLSVEPKHRDADALLWLWFQEIGGEVPLQPGSVRNGLRNAGELFHDPNQMQLPLDE